MNTVKDMVKNNFPIWLSSGNFLGVELDRGLR